MASPLEQHDDIESAITDAELDHLFAPLHGYATHLIAVSGGADSVALMALYARWRSLHRDATSTAQVATVDHGLRPAAAHEAAQVATQAKALGLDHITLTWTGSKPATGLPSAARDARYRLLSAHAATLARGAAAAVVTAHTLDDQAETLLMRLARGSGLDGLAGMAVVRPVDGVPGVVIARPLLRVTGHRLRATLLTLGLTWSDDPTNTDTRSERVRWRQGSPDRAALGLSNKQLALAATRINRAREALHALTLELERRITTHIPGVATRIDRAAFALAPADLQIRLLTRALARCGGDHRAARLSEVERLVDKLNDGSLSPSLTLGGCLIRPGPTITVCRERGRHGLQELHLTPGTSAIWDRRFRVSLAAHAPTACTVRAPTREEWAIMRHQLAPRLPIEPALAVTLPCFWTGPSLVAVPDVLADPYTLASVDSELRLANELMGYFLLPPPCGEGRGGGEPGALQVAFNPPDLAYSLLCRATALAIEPAPEQQANCVGASA